MAWLNIYGLIFVAALMAPNVLYALRCRKGFENRWKNRFVELVEQIGRFGCFGFMAINVPGTYFGWWSQGGFMAYLIVDAALIFAYCLIWIICFRKNSIFRALALSILPSVLFLFSGIMTRSVLLILTSILFAPSHILISYKNAKAGVGE